MNKAVLLIILPMVVAAILIGCGGTGSQGPTPQAMINVRISDPATCQAPLGPYNHVYVTVVDVQASTSSTAGPNDPGWVDLTPTLSQNPVQVDLLGLPQNNCFLAMLGSQTQIPPGNYQQFRVILLDNNRGNTVAGNKCQGNDANCIVLAADNSVHTLNLSSEAQTGIKIPAGQIAGGQVVVASGQTADLDIDFNACASIVITGNGQYRLKPVLHAGEASLQTSSISGRIIDQATGLPIVGGKTIVALEQNVNGTDRMVMETVPDAQGNFTFCPVLQGTYDVVAVAISGNVAYAATVTTGVAAGTAIGSIPMLATTGNNTGPATLTGHVTTSTGSAGAAADIQLSALQSIPGGTMVTVPLAAQSSSIASLETATGGTCAANTGCVSYTIQVPAVNPSVGVFSTSGTNYTQDTTTPVNYTLDALAFVVGSGGTADCSPSEQRTTAITVTPGSSPPVPDLVFTGCNP